jgi:rhodanese-related sulfurtransferase
MELVIGRQGGATEVDLRAGSGRPDAPGVVDGISPERAAELMRAATPPWYVIDVRDSELYVRQGWIEGAMLFELPRMEDNMGDLHVRTDQTVLVYDDDGSRGEEAARLLASYGMPAVRYIEGGYQAWTAEGLPVKTY